MGVTPLAVFCVFTTYCGAVRSIALSVGLDKVCYNINRKYLRFCKNGVFVGAKKVFSGVAAHIFKYIFGYVCRIMN